MHDRPRIAYVLDPRFPGGTSAAVAAELRAVASVCRPSVHLVTSRMFAGQTVAPALAQAFSDLALDPIWDAPQIAAETVILHNPAFLKFDAALGRRIVARDLIVVTHENFERPGGAEGFDVASCLDRIDRGALALTKSLAPVSPLNRATVEGWARRHGMPGGWSLMPEDWFNICDFALKPPTTEPRDRRGRHSRPGVEKFPSVEVLGQCFPARAETNVILGAEILTNDAAPSHWQLFPFRGLDLERYFEMIDFMVYFTAPTWQESFGRVLAEGIAAGKLVISDPATARGFAGGVVPARPDEVDGIVDFYIAHPNRYAAQVARAQEGLALFSPDAFVRRFAALVGISAGVPA